MEIWLKIVFLEKFLRIFELSDLLVDSKLVDLENICTEEVDRNEMLKEMIMRVRWGFSQKQSYQKWRLIIREFLKNSLLIFYEECGVNDNINYC